MFTRYHQASPTYSDDDFSPPDLKATPSQKKVKNN